MVALRKESVDRNGEPVLNFCLPNVALRKESVDRNLKEQEARCKLLEVALRKESVDRNQGNQLQTGGSGQSLSARRAWIEMKHS